MESKTPVKFRKFKVGQLVTSDCYWNGVAGTQLTMALAFGNKRVHSGE